MSRPYTGWDADAKGRRAGTEKLIQIITFLSGNALWNNGSWNVRPMRGKDKPSVHGTGRAADISWRKMENKGSGRYEDAVKAMDLLVAHADLLTIEFVADYFPKPWGRAWKCDRNAWKVYDQQAFHGTPGGDWFHFEISNAHADDPAYFDEAFKQIFSGAAKPAGATPAPAPAPAPAPVAPKPAAKTRRSPKG